MHYDMSKGRMFFLFGAALAFIGMGVIMMDHAIPGILMLTAGIFVMMIGFLILRLNIIVNFRKK